LSKQILLFLLFLSTFSAITTGWFKFFKPANIGFDQTASFFKLKKPESLWQPSQTALKQLSSVVLGDQVKKLSVNIIKTKQGLTIALDQISFRKDETWLFFKVNNQSGGAVILAETFYLWQNNQQLSETKQSGQSSLLLARKINAGDESVGTVYFPKLDPNQPIKVLIEGVFLNDNLTNFAFETIN